MEKEDIYSVVAKAIYNEEKSSGFKENGSATAVLEDFGKVAIGYEYFELEGYEEPCYDVDSPFCGPGGYFGLEAFIVTASLTDENGDDVDIDACELSCCFTEEMTGTDSKSGFIRNYYENN